MNAQDSRPGASTRRFSGAVVVLQAVVFAFLLIGAFMEFPRQSTASTTTGDWTMYLYNHGRGGFNSAETIINPSSAPHLKLHWSYKAGESITTQPVAINGMIYWGSWDGFEHATSLDGTQVWQQNLGQTVDTNCIPSTAGVASTATVASVLVAGRLTSAVFVGGGNATLYALNALTGAVIWRTRLGSSPSHFIWSSPTIYNNSVYIGVSSFGDCPLVQGQLGQMDASTGVIQHTFNTVPAGCTGASVWGSPTIDRVDGSVYFATGNNGSCSTAEQYAAAIVKLSASNLAFIGSWQARNEFGSTPTLFQATISGTVHKLVGLANKNGIYYAFDRGALNQGPVWQATIAISGGCPDCGQGSISSSAWDGTTLYVAGGHTTIAGNSCLGSLRALNPANGTSSWQDCLNDGPVLAAVSAVPGLAVVGEHNHLLVIASATGQILFNYAGTANFWDSASISNGVLYIGNINGTLYAFGT